LISFECTGVDSPVVLSTALDPRFHKLSFLSESQQGKLLDTLVQLASTDDNADYSSTADACKKVEPPMKKRISVLDRLLGDDKQEDDVSVLDEVKSYLQAL